MGQTILEIDNIKVRYSGLPVLQGISLKVDAGETVCVLGSNGAGKSTLIRAIMGTQPAFEGRILFKEPLSGRIRTE
jgi:branched-chain amino acid transport system ATP-binding protein